MAHSPPLLITIGEPAGIGPDCIIRAWHNDHTSFINTVIVCPPDWLIERAAGIGISIPICEINSLHEKNRKDALICWNPEKASAGKITPGQPSKHTAQSVINCIKDAAEACLQGHARALVTGPIEKSTLREAGFAFPGHTEFLADISGTPDVVMMLAGPTLRVALLTTHMALKDVSSALSITATLKSICITDDELRRCFGISKPRLGLCGLNPHAGESGHFGREEIEILAPAAEAARLQGIDLTGPLPSDTLFSAPMRSQFDAIVCCYHDQGLIPIKALEFGKSVNVTLGLPFVRTSVDHGTALSRAGSDQVTYSSLMDAIHMAKTMSQESADASQ